MVDFRRPGHIYVSSRYMLLLTFLHITRAQHLCINCLSEIENFSMKNSNTHKYLPVIDRVDKVIHDPNKAFSAHGIITHWHVG